MIEAFCSRYINDLFLQEYILTSCAHDLQRIRYSTYLHWK